ncbi:MAG: glycosyltransferase [Candidatus Aenigmatarchaeota archaeon]
MEIHSVSLLLYNIFLIPIIFFSCVYFLVAISTIIFKIEKRKFSKPKDKSWPFVSIQIPVYNDPVAKRCIEKCLKFDYPKDKFEIIVADDSTDELTIKILDQCKKYKNVKIVRRDTRKGFKAGALNNALKYTKGEIIVVFDSDFVPPKNFLKRIVTPFLKDEKIAIVQSKMGFLNYDQNIITKFASSLLAIYYNCWINLKNKFETVFFCGSGGAIKKEVLLKVNGWNEENVTEDTDLSIKILEAGYKHIYLPNLKVSGEVPFTLTSFLKQQMRWAYGVTFTFKNYWKKIWFSPSFSLVQRIIITLITFGWVISPFVLLTTFFGQLAWITGTPRPIQISDIVKFFTYFALTSGFLVLATVGLYREKMLSKVAFLFPASLTIGICLSFVGTIAFFKALFGFKHYWFRTPKFGSISIIEFFKKIFMKK